MTSRARFSAVLPVAISSSTAGVTRVADLIEREPEIARPHHLALAHRNAAEHLGEVFAEPDAHQQVFQLAEAAGRAHALRVGAELAHRLHIGRKPRKPVRGALLAVEQLARDAPVLGDARSDRAGGVGKQRLDGGGRLAGACGQIGASVGTGRGEHWGTFGHGSIQA